MGSHSRRTIWPGNRAKIYIFLDANFLKISAQSSNYLSTKFYDVLQVSWYACSRIEFKFWACTYRSFLKTVFYQNPKIDTVKAVNFKRAFLIRKTPVWKIQFELPRSHTCYSSFLTYIKENSTVLKKW